MIGMHYWEWIRARVAEEPGTPRVLDVGCGDGNTWRRGWHGQHAVEIPPEAVPAMDLWGLDADDLADWPGHFVQGRAEALPFPDGRFDVVIASQILEHVADPVSVLREADRVLHPGGALIVTVPLGAHPDLETDGDRLALANPHIHYRQFIPDAEFPHHAHVRRFADLAELRALLAGLPGRVVQAIQATCDGGPWAGAVWRRGKGVTRAYLAD